MAADDDRGQTPDPWDEIVADGLGDGGGEVSFNFDEVVEEKPAEPVSAADPGEDPPQVAEPVSAAGEDALIDDWLSGDDASEPSAPAPSGFPGDENAAGSSGIEIGTGTSGVALHGAPEEGSGVGTFGDEPSAESATDEWPAIDTSAGDADDAGSSAGFPVVTDAAPSVTTGTAAPAAKKSTGRPAKPAKPAKKSGGIGQLIGVVLGGAMAIPITLAILIYGLGKDPFGVTKSVPAEVAYLLPEKFRPGYKKPVTPKPDADGSSALDALPTSSDPVEPAVEPPPPEPATVPGDGEPVMPADPATPPVTDVATIEPPGLDALDTPPGPPAPAEPPPLDTAALDEAVAEAAALCEALGAVDDRGGKAYGKLRIRWYRALARVAEELVAMENIAATTGRPLAGAPENVASLHGTIGGREPLAAELAALAPDWLAYANRGSDGVVVPVTFESARRVGPYWTARVSLAAPSGSPRDITVISRSEPAAVAGDSVVVTGVALDGTVIWAADVRGSGSGSPPGL